MITRNTVLETIEALSCRGGLPKRIGAGPADRREVAEAASVEETPFGLFVVESADTIRVCVAAYDGDNELKGAIINTAPDAVE